MILILSSSGNRDTTAPRRGRGGRGRGRGGRRNSQEKPSKSAEELDAEMEAYMKYAFTLSSPQPSLP